jgi:ubiquinone/menaquinone biosynthesis C-methylase UbiE
MGSKDDVTKNFSKRDLSRQFDQCAPYYGSHLKTVGERVQIEIERRAILDRIRRSRFDRALDIGCGPGKYMVEVSTRGETIGIDFSSDMTRIAKKSVNSGVVLADMEFLPFRNNSFDLIYSIRVMKYLKSQSRLLREAQRLCRNRGRIILYDVRHIGINYLMLQMYIFLRKIFPPRYVPQPRELERLMPFRICALLSQSGAFDVKCTGVLFLPWRMYRHFRSNRVLNLLALLDRLLSNVPFSQYLASSVLYTAVKR